MDMKRVGVFVGIGLVCSVGLLLVGCCMKAIMNRVRQECVMNQNFEFSWEFKNFCIRTVHQGDDEKNKKLRKDCPIELVRYFDDRHKSSYVVAWYRLDECGYELHFIGSRPLNDISGEEMAFIWPQLQAAQKMLDAYFQACEETEED